VSSSIERSTTRANHFRDEINRAGPRTQAALLEAMEERQVTVDGVTHLLPRPSSLWRRRIRSNLRGRFRSRSASDRFLMRVALGYPNEDDERAILRRFRAANPLDELAPVVGADEILALQKTRGKCSSIPLSRNTSCA